MMEAIKRIEQSEKVWGNLVKEIKDLKIERKDEVLRLMCEFGRLNYSRGYRRGFNFGYDTGYDDGSD